MVEIVPLIDLVGKPISGEWGDGEGNIKVLRTTNFTNEGCLRLNDVVTRSIDSKKVEKKKLIKGDIIIEKSGGSPNQPVGRVVYFEEDGIYLCNNFTSVLRVKNKRVFSKYLHYILFSAHKGGVTQAFQNKTTGIINLKLNNYLEDIKIPLPPLATQKKIAAILDAANAHRQKTKQLLAKYDELAQSIFLEMFGEIEGEDFSMLELSDTSEKGTFSNGPFGSDLLTSELTNQGIPVIYIRDIRNGEFQWKSQVFITNEKAQYLKNCQVKQGDVLIAKVGDPPGATAIYPNDALAVITQDVIRLRPNLEKVTPEFLQFWFNSKLGLRVLQPIIVQGTRQRFGLGDLKKIRLKVPSISKQRYFSKIIEGLNSQLLIGRNQYLESENLFNSLLQKAFKGELVK